ncbi:hypothetical protein ACIG5E_36365 [Kitasatospora sp. NPDC053057]|uniref:hypothetical protein n=1 Tax=Kitasatospora sp. NPDC053057 TaxID=3364062 RepID=UPI0037C6673D
MTTSTAISTAQPRKRRTRTKNISYLPAIVASTLPVNLIELTPGKEHLACPGCDTWCPITSDKGSKQWKLVPHHTLPAGTPGARRCSNSNRLVDIDISLVCWQEQRVEASADVAARRPTKVLKKVKTPILPAITQLDPAPATADSARRTYETHRVRCATCTTNKNEKDSTLRVKHCPDGERLAITYLRLLRQEPRRIEAEARLEEQRRADERAQAAALPKRRAAEWQDVQVDVLLAKRRRAKHIVGDLVEPIRGTGVPTEQRNTQEQSQALAKTRTAQAIREASPLRKTRKKYDDTTSQALPA